MEEAGCLPGDTFGVEGVAQRGVRFLSRGNVILSNGQLIDPGNRPLGHCCLRSVCAAWDEWNDRCIGFGQVRQLKD